MFNKKKVDEQVTVFYLYGEGDSDKPEPKPNANCQDYGVCDTEVNVYC